MQAADAQLDGQQGDSGVVWLQPNAFLQHFDCAGRLGGGQKRERVVTPQHGDGTMCCDYTVQHADLLTLPAAIRDRANWYHKWNSSKANFIALSRHCGEARRQSATGTQRHIYTGM